MVFNVGNGLSEMGKSLNQTFQAYNVEAQKAELETQRLKLANDLAMERESVGRRETAQYAEQAAEKQRGWQSGENLADRTSREKMAEENNRTAITTAGISAGASRYTVDQRTKEANARLDFEREVFANNKTEAEEKRRFEREVFENRKVENTKNLEAQYDALTKIQIGDDGAAYTVNPATGKVTPLKVDGESLKFRDPDVAKAQHEMARLKISQLNDLTRTYTPQIQGLEESIRKLSADPMAAVDAEKKQTLAEAQGRLKALTERYAAEQAPIVNDLNRYSRAFESKGKVGDQGPTGGAKLSDFDRGPPPSPSGAPAAGPGVVNSW